MKSWLAGLVVFAVVGCGGDDAPTEPIQRSQFIELEITWPLATHPSMETPQFWEVHPDSCGFWECRSSTRFFRFDSEGTVLTSFRAPCESGDTNSASYVYALNTETQTYCKIPVEWICQNRLQRILVETPADDPDCQVTPN